MKPYVAFMDDAVLQGATPQEELLEGQTCTPSLVETLPVPNSKELKGAQAQESIAPPIPWEAEEPTEEPASMEEPTEELATVEEPTEEPATAEEPPVEPSTSVANVRELAEEPDTPQCSSEVGEEREGSKSATSPAWMQR